MCCGWLVAVCLDVHEQIVVKCKLIHKNSNAQHLGAMDQDTSLEIILHIVLSQAVLVLTNQNLNLEMGKIQSLSGDNIVIDL